MSRLKYLLIVPLILFCRLASAQSVATSNDIVPEKHSAHKASLYSTFLPGLGQFYNKKYWKIPIIYAGFGTITYFVITNKNEYVLAKEAYVYVSNGEDYPIDNKYVGKYSESDLIQIRDYYRRNTELSIIFLGVWYVLNIVDATVDAHFFDYDISDNLSLHLQPATITPSISIPAHNQPYSVLNQPTIISLKFNF